MVFYLCVPALMRWGRGGRAEKNILHHQGVGGSKIFFFLKIKIPIAPPQPINYEQSLTFLTLFTAQKR